MAHAQRRRRQRKASSREPARFLQNFDFVPVGVLHKEKPGKLLAIPLHLFERAWVKPFALESGVLGRDVVNHESDMAVAVAEIVGLRAASVHGQFDLKGSGFVVEVDKLEIVEGESAGDVQIEGATRRNQATARRQGRGSSCG